MKTIIKVFLFTCALSAFAQEPATNVPPDLAVARAHYQATLESVRKQYLQELQRLKADAIVANNSELVAAVTREIESLGGNDTGTTDAQSDLDDTEAPTLESLTTKLTNTTWVWFENQTITLLRDGVAKWSDNGANIFTWSVVAVSPPTIEGKAANGTEYKMTLDANLRAGQIFQTGQPARMTSRVRHPVTR